MKTRRPSTSGTAKRAARKVTRWRSLRRPAWRSRFARGLGLEDLAEVERLDQLRGRVLADLVAQLALSPVTSWARCAARSLSRSWPTDFMRALRRSVSRKGAATVSTVANAAMPTRMVIMVSICKRLDRKFEHVRYSLL